VPLYYHTYPNTLGTFLGFPAGTYGGGSSSGSCLSNITPVGSNVNSLIVRCNLAINPGSIPSNILDNFPINNSFGSNINYVPNFEKWIKIRADAYSKLIITSTGFAFSYSSLPSSQIGQM